MLRLQEKQTRTTAQAVAGAGSSRLFVRITTEESLSIPAVAYKRASERRQQRQAPVLVWYDD